MSHFDDMTSGDARVQRTRRDLFQAFAQLVLHKRYDDIQVSHIIERAGIARSTFYEHFSSKDAILVDSMSGMLAVLAITAVDRNNERELRDILIHFWDNRAFGRIILNGPAYRLITQRLVVLIERRLDQSETQPDRQVPAQLLAIQLAEAMLAPIRSWLSGEVACDSGDLARHLIGGLQS